MVPFLEDSGDLFDRSITVLNTGEELSFDLITSVSLNLHGKTDGDLVPTHFK